MFPFSLAHFDTILECLDATARPVGLTPFRKQNCHFERFLRLGNFSKEPFSRWKVTLHNWYQFWENWWITPFYILQLWCRSWSGTWHLSAGITQCKNHSSTTTKFKLTPLDYISEKHEWCRGSFHALRDPWAQISAPYLSRAAKEKTLLRNAISNT